MFLSITDKDIEFLLDSPVAIEISPKNSDVCSDSNSKSHPLPSYEWVSIQCKAFNPRGRGG